MSATAGCHTTLSLMRAITRNFTLRLALSYLMLFAVSVSLLLAFVYWSASGFMARQSDELIEEEITGLAEHYDLLGINGLRHLIEQRVNQQRTGQALYLLTNENRAPLAGNLESWPKAKIDAQGWLNFALVEETDQSLSVHPGRARHFLLPHGYHLLVGRDIAPMQNAIAHVQTALLWGSGVVIVLGVIGGWWISHRMTRRIELINRTLRGIITGDLSRRMPLQGSGDELDRLSQQFNQMLDRIQQLMEDVRRVSDNIAHDLRTPLGRLHQHLEQLQQELQLQQIDAAPAEHALRESEGLLNTFNALLRIARIEANHSQTPLPTVNLADMLRDLVEYYEPLAEAEQQSIQLQLADELSMHGDRDLLFQTLANLLDNAIKYSPEHGEITLSLQAESPTQGIISIADRGPGIPKAERKQIFQRFFRLESSRSSPGVGLGLSLVDAVIQRHNMHIAVQDNQPGTRFLLRFKPV